MDIKALRYRAKQGLVKTKNECMDQISKGKFTWFQGYYLLMGRVTALSELGLLDSIEAQEMLNDFYIQGGMGYENQGE